jgi:transposase
MASSDRAGEDIENLKRQLAAERSARAAAEARAAEAAARATSAEVLIAHLRLAIEKLKRDLYGSRSEHGRKLLDQMELELEELVANAAEDTAKREIAPRGERIIPAHTRRHPLRRSLPEHLPRERVIVWCRLIVSV